MRALGPSFTDYLETFIKKAMEGYEKNSIGSFVYTVEFCLTEYGQKPEYAELFQKAFEFICQQTSQVLATKNNCARNFELVNDFFGLSLRYIRYNKVIFYSSSTLEILMKELTMNALGVDNYEAAKVHSSFIIEMTRGLKQDLSQQVDLAHISILQPQQQMWAFLRTYGGEMVKQYIRAILKVPSK